MAKFNREICKECRAVFVKENESQQHCSFMCDVRSKGPSFRGCGIRYEKYICQACQRVFNSSTINKCCSDFCRGQLKRSPRKTEEEKAEVQNRLWLENNSPTKRLEKCKRHSYEQLNKIEEYKRVYSKCAWDHYEKGRKWDKI